MIRQLFLLGFVVTCLLLDPSFVAAQDAGEDQTEIIEAEVTPDDTFERIASRAEDLAANEDASLFAMTRLRAELVIWRDGFIEAANANAGRLATVEAHQVQQLVDASRRPLGRRARRSIPRPRQMPDPQPGWAQQYDYDMRPMWARKFEPAAITISAPS